MKQIKNNTFTESTTACSKPSYNKVKKLLNFLKIEFKSNDNSFILYLEKLTIYVGVKRILFKENNKKKYEFRNIQNLLNFLNAYYKKDE